MSSLRHPTLLALGALLVSCTGPGENAAASDAGAAPPPGGFELLIDAGMPRCRTDAAPDARPAVDAGPCVPSRHVSFRTDVAPLLSQRCTGEICHEGTWGGPSAIAYLVGVQAAECCDGRLRVAPGAPEQSYVIQKLRGVDLCAGRPMPLSGTISAAEIQTLEDWICEGATP